MLHLFYFYFFLQGFGFSIQIGLIKYTWACWALRQEFGLSPLNEHCAVNESPSLFGPTLARVP